jgi:NhaP-type Na+/H+ or K+/H+ antiporter
MLFLIVGYISTSLVKFFWKKRFIPHTVIYLILGLVFGLLNKYVYLGELSEDTNIWANISSHDLLLYFVPPLIFHSAYSINYNEFLRYKYHISILTIFPLILSVFLLGIIINSIVSFNNNNLIKSIILGIILSATDPVTIVTILEKLNLSKFVHILLESESLLNDGLSILLYNIFSNILLKSESSNFILLGLTPILSFIFALFCYYVFSFFLKKIKNDSLLETSLFLIIPFFIFYISELLKMSGVFVLVIFGLNMARYGNLNISTNTINILEHFLSVSRYLFNTILFFLLGVIVVSRINFYKLYYTDYLIAFFIYIISNFIRFLAVGIFFPVFYKINKNISFKDIIILSLSGMKGEITVVLSLSTHNLLDDDDYNKALLILFTNVVLSIIFNSIFLELFLQKFYNKNKILLKKKQIIKNTVNKIVEKSRLYFENLKEEENFLNNTDWNYISNKIGFGNDQIIERELMNLNELFINILIKKNRFLFIKGIINNKAYNNINKILDIDEDIDHFDSILIEKLNKKLNESSVFKYFKKNILVEQYSLIISFLLLIDLSFKKLHNFIDNQVLEININYKYNCLREYLIERIQNFEGDYQHITSEIENKHAIKMIIINQINNLKEYFKDGEIDKHIYDEILAKITYKLKNMD